MEHSDVDLDLHLKESPLLIMPLDVTLKFRTRWKSPGSPSGTDKEWAMLDRGANWDPLNECGMCAEWRLALNERDRLWDLLEACVVLKCIAEALRVDGLGLLADIRNFGAESLLSSDSLLSRNLSEDLLRDLDGERDTLVLCWLI